MANQQQIQQALKYTMTGSLVNGAAVITDITPYIGIGIASPNTVLVLLQILDPTGNLFYQNINWNAGTYGNPDLQPIAGTGAGYTTYSFIMPTDITGAYLTGQYTINLQVQVVQSGITTVVQNTQYATICNCCNGIHIRVLPNVSYNTAQVSVTDDTQYGSYVALSRVMTLYAPPPALQTPQVGNNVTTLVWVPPINTFPATGTWTWTLASTITYIDNVTQAQTTCEITSEGTFDVVQSQLCVVLCQLEEWRNIYWQTAKLKDTTQLTINYGLAINEFVLAMQSQICGRPQSQIDAHVRRIYDITGIDPNCPCSCNTGTGQPLVPTNAINGTNGTNGSNFLQGVGAPASGLGNVGDSYLDSSTGNIYKKTGATTWTQTANIMGATGATGAAGANGTSVLYNHFANVATPDTSLDTLDNFTIGIGQFANAGDEVDVQALFKVNTNAGTPASQYVQLNIVSTGGGGGTITPSQEIGPSVVNVGFTVKLVRVGSGTLKYIVTTKQYKSSGAIETITVGSFAADFAATITVAAQAQSVTNGDLTSQYLSGYYLAE